MKFLVIQKPSISEDIFQTLKHNIKYSYLLMSLCLFMSRASRFVVTVLQTAELFLLGVLFLSSFIMIFYGGNSVDFLRIISDLHDCKGGQSFGVPFLFFLCICTVFKVHLIVSAELSCLASVALKWTAEWSFTSLISALKLTSLLYG